MVKPSKKSITIANLCHYFDAEVRDRIDQGSINQRMAWWMAMRDRLAKLPQDQWAAVRLAIQGVVDGATNDRNEVENDQNFSESRKEGLKLYRVVQTPTEPTVPTSDAVPKV